jgi:clan AA aspartic protease (TIGR02281 family)
MPHLFTVRWPYFARFEAILFFPVLTMLAGQSDVVRTIVDRGLVPSLAPFGLQIGLSIEAVIWGSTAIAVVVPYLVLLLVADRTMTVRKGYAVSSVIAIATWAGATLALSDQLANFVPDSFVDGAVWRPFGQEAAFVAGGTAFLLHLIPLWIGLRDDGTVAMRLVAAHEEHEFRQRQIDQDRHPQDVYFRQTADFRSWRPQEQLAGLGGNPRENPAVKILYAVTWIGVVIAVGAAYHSWNEIAAGRGIGNQAPGVQAGPSPASHGAVAVAPGAKSGLPISPPMSTQNAHTVSVPPLPSIQRPGELRGGIRTANAQAGPNEAVAERGPDGGFAFDALVNGTRVTMLFDTGTSVVAIRAEDAVRLGIPVAKLTWSAKVKTANGSADVAPIVIETLTVGNITQRNVTGFVAKQGSLQDNLLGQTFLARLSGYNVDKNVLLLKGR